MERQKLLNLITFEHENETMVSFAYMNAKPNKADLLASTN